MPEDRTPIDHGLAHPQPERGQIPQPKPQADEDPRELVPHRTTDQKPQPGVGGKDDFVQQPD
ncbi:hypothetical protein [Ramlibacter pallidus]|uniref:Uncharacterized protein n=1 Tax=Ramlibacter pallidus TaxID=2780087 RepID=A0ABR9RZU6_9BURK|nr:hypothetical protein [Ramlibacter pallidus]MBE7366777.1 hypothetical protein [Ramlibacter pallidus]